MWEIRAFPHNSLVVKNIGTQPIKITDILVNERIECSATSPIELTGVLLSNDRTASRSGISFG